MNSTSIKLHGSSTSIPCARVAKTFPKGLKHRLATVTMLEEKIRVVEQQRNVELNALEEQNIKCKAQYIEQMLHCHGLTSTTDLEKDLNNKLIEAMVILLKKRKITPGNDRNRLLVLRKCVVNDTFRRICGILQVVHDIRKEYSCSNGACFRPSSVALKANENIPLPVQRIFQMELMLVIERAPVSLFKSLPWDTLLTKATQDIEEYQEWKMSRYSERLKQNSS